eukprot:TRINITY_DN5795_c0_g1_i1.p1 TRINITY_DN5795_c0_g1~~TRINITY_DN5795_c0_g1_i1.p1  ORF type:complete len:243 (-),score=33.77 TRINITY_DN5795_c0_g1_i1:70-798(-)
MAARTPNTGPSTAVPQPEDELRRRFEIVEAQVHKDVEEWMWHGWFSIGGLVLTITVQIAAWNQRMFPAVATSKLHLVASVSSIFSIVAGTCFFSHRARLWLLRSGYLPLAQSTVFAILLMNLLLFLMLLLWLTPPRHLAPSWVPLIERMQFQANVWEASLLAEVGFGVVMVCAVFRIYRELRIAGLYPMNSRLIQKGKRLEGISPMEIVCEESELAQLQSMGLCGAEVLPTETEQELLVTPG